MYRTILVCLLVALLAMAGCNKADSKKSSPAGAGVAKATPTAGATTEDMDTAKPAEPKLGVTTIESRDAQLDEEYPPLPDEDIQFIRSELIRLAPEHNFAYDDSANVIVGDGLPETGLDLEKLVDKVEMEGRRNLEKLNHDLLSQWCSRIFREIKPQEKDQARPNRREQQERESSGGNTSGSTNEGTTDVTESNENSLVFAASAIGEWKSIREDHPRITTYHNDDYFEFYRFMHDGLAELKFYRNQKMVVIKQYTFEYNPRNGKISLFDDSKKLVETLVLKMEPNDDDILFVEFPDKDSITVLERIGTGYPTTDNDDAPGLMDLVNQ